MRDRAGFATTATSAREVLTDSADLFDLSHPDRPLENLLSSAHGCVGIR
ncbi:hypothetical protein [Brevibacterium linens]|nr:hypothetical protein [Brevibacterium linens]